MGTRGRHEKTAKKGKSYREVARLKRYDDLLAQNNAARARAQRMTRDERYIALLDAALMRATEAERRRDIVPLVRPASGN